MFRKAVLSAIAATALTGGTFTATPAHADDRKVRTGDCSAKPTTAWCWRTSTATTIETGSGRRSLSMAPRANAMWGVTIKRNGNVVDGSKKRANDQGAVRFTKRFPGDDDAVIKVMARAQYGERCSRGMRLDD